MKRKRISDNLPTISKKRTLLDYISQGDTSAISNSDNNCPTPSLKEKNVESSESVVIEPGESDNEMESVVIRLSDGIAQQSNGASQSRGSPQNEQSQSPFQMMHKKLTVSKFFKGEQDAVVENNLNIVRNGAQRTITKSGTVRKKLYLPKTSSSNISAKEESITASGSRRISDVPIVTKDKPSNSSKEDEQITPIQHHKTPTRRRRDSQVFTNVMHPSAESSIDGSISLLPTMQPTQSVQSSQYSNMLSLRTPGHTNQLLSQGNHIRSAPPAERSKKSILNRSSDLKMPQTSVLKNISKPTQKLTSDIFGDATPYNKETLTKILRANKNLKARPVLRPTTNPTVTIGSMDRINKFLEYNGEYKSNPEYTRLSAEQRHVLDTVMGSQDSVFFTGAAGCGKSHLLRVMIDFLRDKYGEDSVFITASTGIAGCNIGGTTVHSFAGIGLGKGTKETLLPKVNSNKPAVIRWQGAHVLIIDEVSMLHAELLDKLDFIARSIKRKKNKFFGGIQLILVGDFFQLPPVSNHEMKFCFEAECWKEIPHTFVLKQVFRQKNPEFVEILNEMRQGNLSRKGEELLMACMHKNFDFSDGIKPTELFPLKKDVERENLAKLDQLPDKPHTFSARDRGSKQLLEFLDKNCQAPSKLILKRNAQVVLLKNKDFNLNLVNGSRGVVTGFHETTGNPLIRFESVSMPIEIKREEFEVEMGKERAIRDQYPLALAFSMSIHKAQGMTLNRVCTSLKEVFAPGQAYVSISRVTSLEGLSLTSFDKRKIFAHPKVVEFYNRLSNI